jgi:hypothetical protein
VADPAQWQAILNERPIPPRRIQRNCDTPVRVRVVWERDGVEVRETTARGYTSDAVLVIVADWRRQTIGVWLSPTDVQRLYASQTFDT